MKQIRFALLLVFCQIFFLMPCLAMDEENPFAKMIDRSYPENWVELTTQYTQLSYTDSLQGLRLTQQIREVAQQTGSDYWQLEADFFRVNYNHREEVRNAATTQETMLQLEEIAQQALLRHHPGIRIRALETIMRAYRDILQNYEMAFEYSRILADELEQVDASIYIDKLQAYRIIGDLYYMFGDLEGAAFYYAKLLDDKGKKTEQEMLHHFPAYCNLGLIARKKDNDIATSDSLYNRVLYLAEQGNETYRRQGRVWKGIIYSQLGDNRYFENDYESAIPLYQQSLEIMVDYNDPHFVAGTSIRLANLYLLKGELKACKSLLDQARTCIDQSYQQRRYHELFPVLSKYYAAIGDRSASMAYLDSAMIAQEAYNKQFSSLQLLRAEQRNFKLEQIAREEELHTEQVRSRGYRLLSQAILAGFVIALGLLLYILYIYRKKQAAYRELVRRAQAWAVERPATLREAATANAAWCENTDDDEYPEIDNDDESDQQIAQAVITLMDAEKIFLAHDLTLDTLALRLKVNRSYLSKAINQSIGKKFTDYVNEYRIREAIHRLNDPLLQSQSLEGLAAECGFNDRISFYRVFKKITGLSPSEYRKNMR
ncbi:helix-turn-helix domain-containing protein [Parabacteroides sp. PF5-6]|uniref:helix-turn-helix domain-containing protein n=1 Tax=Parabacteroides sp. PF5-6 TaxID=1742403 RepID=UPI002404E6D5|nr:helix-turn-helix domain-containing protein [Parabacteroides sp. PF5-6]MDF9828993.1 YesN/AraC family two-component response regulator [Parabacteroides sp. PF5-6]